MASEKVAVPMKRCMDMQHCKGWRQRALADHTCQQRVTIVWSNEGSMLRLWKGTNWFNCQAFLELNALKWVLTSHVQLEWAEAANQSCHGTWQACPFPFFFYESDKCALLKLDNNDICVAPGVPADLLSTKRPIKTNPIRLCEAWFINRVSSLQTSFVRSSLCFLAVHAPTVCTETIKALGPPSGHLTMFPNSLAKLHQNVIPSWTKIAWWSCAKMQLHQCWLRSSQSKTKAQPWLLRICDARI